MSSAEARARLKLLSLATAPAANEAPAREPQTILDSLPVLGAPRLSGPPSGRYAVLQLDFVPGWPPQLTNELPPGALPMVHSEAAQSMVSDFNRGQMTSGSVEKWAVLVCGPKGAEAVAVLAIKEPWRPRAVTDLPPCFIAQGLDRGFAYNQASKLNDKTVTESLKSAALPKVWHVVGLRIGEDGQRRRRRSRRKNQASVAQLHAG